MTTKKIYISFVDGFSLIELLVVLAILSVLASIALPVGETIFRRQQEQYLRTSLREIRAGIDAYKNAVDEGRIGKNAGASGYPESLEILVEGKEDLRDPNRRKIYFLRRIPVDPFAKEVSAGGRLSWKKRSYQSDAADPKEGEDVFDVYSGSKQVGTNNIPYNQW
jgi:general secretion pathway protein G